MFKKNEGVMGRLGDWVKRDLIRIPFREGPGVGIKNEGVMGRLGDWVKGNLVRIPSWEGQGVGLFKT